MADRVPSEWRSKIVHSTIEVGEMVLMGSDPVPESYLEPKGFSLAVVVNDTTEAERIFSALAENATVYMPLQETFWAASFGMLVDRLGMPWMISCQKNA